jgi:hypothetical protein
MAYNAATIAMKTVEAPKHVQTTSVHPSRHLTGERRCNDRW